MSHVDEVLARIREEGKEERETGLLAVDPYDNDALLDLVLTLAARVTTLEKHLARETARVNGKFYSGVGAT